MWLMGQRVPDESRQNLGKIPEDTSLNLARYQPNISILRQTAQNSARLAQQLEPAQTANLKGSA